MLSLATAGKAALMATTLGVVVWLSVSKTRNPLKSPLVVVVMCLMTTLIGGLAVLGVDSLSPWQLETRFLPIAVILAALLGGVTVLVIAAVADTARGMFALAGIPALLIVSWLAAVGLEHVSYVHIRVAFLPWILSSLGMAFAIYFVAAVQRTRSKGGTDDRPTGIHRQDDSRREDDI